MRRNLLSGLAAAVALVAFGACSSSSGASGVAADRASAKRAVLTAADLPAGLSLRPYRSGGATEGETSGRARRCTHSDPVALDRATERSAATHFEHEGVVLASTVRFYENTQQVDARWRDVSNLEVETCVAAGLAAGLRAQVRTQPDASVGTPTVAALSLPAHGQRQVAYRMQLPLTQGQQHRSITYDVVYVAQGRATASLAVLDADEPFDPAIEASLIGKVAARLTAD